MSLQHTIKAVIRPGEQSGLVAECMEIAAVTQGSTLDEVTANLREAVALHLEGEDLADLGLAPVPTILITLEVGSADPRFSGPRLFSPATNRSGSHGQCVPDRGFS